MAPDSFLILASSSGHAPGVGLLLTELMIVVTVALVVKYIRLPYTIALVAAGLGLGILRAQHYLELDLQLTPELVFSIFLPALLFEAAFNLHLNHLRENIRPVLLMAIVGVLMAALGVAYVLHILLGMPLAAAMVFGALISATDPISVLALFKEMKAPPRINILVEGESLLNDGAAVVIFKIILAFALTGHFALAESVVQFLLVSVGGLALGAAMGYVFSEVNRHVDDHLVEVTLSTILAYGSYLGAEHVGASGVMSVIAAGLVYGNYGKRIGMSPNTRMMMGVFWEYFGFLMNSLVFLLIGTQVDLRLLTNDLKLVVLAFVAVVLVRAAVVVILAPLFRIMDRPIPAAWHVIMVWAGLRGSISMALAMGLPASLSYRQDIILMTFGVVIMSLFIQGLTMPPLLKVLKVVGASRPVVEYEERLGKVLLHEKALSELRRLKDELFLAEKPYRELEAYHGKMLERARADLAAHNQGEDAIMAEQLKDARREVQSAQLAALHDAHDRGLLSDEALERLIDHLAERESAAELEEEDQERGQSPQGREQIDDQDHKGTDAEVEALLDASEETSK